MYRVLSPREGLTFFESRMSIEHGNPRKHDLSTEAALATVQRLWSAEHQDTKKCIHYQPCKRRFGTCTYESRTHVEAIIAGTILPLWKALGNLTTDLDGRGAPKHMRVTRLRLQDGTRIVGVKVHRGRTAHHTPQPNADAQHHTLQHHTLQPITPYSITPYSTTPCSTTPCSTTPAQTPALHSSAWD